MATKGPVDRKASPATRRAEPATIRVRATAVGFYDDVRRRIGDVFTLHARRGTFTALELDDDGKPALDDSGLLKTRITTEVEKTLTAEEQFAPKWMQRVSADTPEYASSANEQIRSQHDVILASRMSGESTAMQVPGAGSAGTPPASGDEDVL